MRPEDLAQLKDDLLAFRSELEDESNHHALVEAALPRILATLDMIPDESRNGDFLELGAAPFFTTLCLRHLVRGRLALGNYFATGAKTGRSQLTNQRTGEEIDFDYDLFNVETDEFPYPDGSFDVVVFSELIEHLGINPIWTLSEIHRILRPGGLIIVTTPNVLSMERLSTFVYGAAQMVDRYSPLFGYGARHNREYRPIELHSILDETGYEVEQIIVRDLVSLPKRERWHRTLWKWLVSWYSDAPREEHIFARARRREPFRWTFPNELFDNVQFYVLVRYPWVAMGINDSIQCGAGWQPLEDRTVDLRWTDGEGQAFLKTPEQTGKLHVELRATEVQDSEVANVRLLVQDRWLGRVDPGNVYVDTAVNIEQGDWQRIELPLRRNPSPGDELEVLVSRTSTDGCPIPLAVRRIWLGDS